MTPRRRPEDPEALFAELLARFSADSAVTPPAVEKGGRFGASGLKVEGRIFAMLSKGELVVKLPRERVDQLIASGTGSRFDPGHGRLMKEWVTIAPRHGPSWAELAEEARQFVGGRPAPKRTS
jgi:TfoX/Sxy family transcriptional regulator of competence genes